MREILIATSNAGKLRDFAAAAVEFEITVAPVPGLAALPPAKEDAPTFEANACKKAEYYSRAAQNQYVLADDSGLEVDALGGAPGVRSARYAHEETDTHENATDEANNARLLAELRDIPQDRRTARFVCCIAVARNGRTVVCFRGEVQGRILDALRGTDGFGYDPLFYLPECRSTFAELSPEQKGKYSHRGSAFRKFLKWYAAQEMPAQAAPSAAHGKSVRIS